MKVKWWLWVLLALGCVIVIGGSIGLLFPNLNLHNLFDNPEYAPGEAIAMVERVYQWHDNSADLYSDLYEEYLGKDIWEVKSSSTYGGEQAIFRVYEQTDTVQIYNDVARWVLNRREQLEQQLEQQPPSTPTDRANPFE